MNFNADFPLNFFKLSEKDRGVKVNDTFLAKTDFTGKIGTTFSYVLLL